MFSIDDYELIQNESELAKFKADNQDITWMSLDTEFIGERRYQTLLCLIQVATERGLYVLDPLKLSNIQPILDLIINPNVTKITHAGENDYRLINELYGIFPINVFDTQIAAGFLGYKFPISFRKLVEEELGIRLSKDQTVTDWEMRPMKNGQIKYALEDIIPLHSLWQRLTHKISTLQRLDWVQEETQRLEQKSFYDMKSAQRSVG
ncbi:MAG: ribonuclease D [Saprospiraceae bacterium]|nr:ribonuclease D [Saprospiraceae bacterium]